MKILAIGAGLIALVVTLGIAADLATGKGGSGPVGTPPPPSVDAEAEALIPRAEGEDLSQKGPGPGITIRGDFVPLPAEATIITIIGDGPVGSGPIPEMPITVQYRNSRVTFTPSDGVALERAVDRADEAALGPLLGALRSGRW